MTKFFECKVKFYKMTEDGVMKPVKETYAVDALSFTEAEARVTQHMQPYVAGDMEVTAIRVANYKEYVDTAQGEKYFLVKYTLVTIDEATAKERRTNMFTLFRNEDIDHAKEMAHEYMKGAMTDYEITSIKETPIVDVLINGD